MCSSAEAIEGMVKEAEKFKLTHAKNKLESYCFNMKTTLDDEKVKDKSIPLKKSGIL